MKKIISISLLVLTIIGLITLTGFIVRSNMQTKIANVEIKIFRNTNNGFVNEASVLSTINNIDSIDNIKIEKVDIEKIEKALSQNLYIDKVDCYVTISGNLLVNIKEKQPVIKIYDKESNGIYIDNAGDIFPVSKQFAPRVIIANGYIKTKVSKPYGNIADSIYSNTIFPQIFQLSQLINNHSLLKNQITQIYVNSIGNYDLIPTLGDHIIQFGSFNNAKTKIRNLNAYYTKYLKSSSWDDYKTINLTYNNQIVCTKK